MRSVRNSGGRSFWWLTAPPSLSGGIILQRDLAHFRKQMLQPLTSHPHTLNTKHVKVWTSEGHKNTFMILQSVFDSEFMWLKLLDELFQTSPNFTETEKPTRIFPSRWSMMSGSVSLQHTSSSSRRRHKSSFQSFCCSLSSAGGESVWETERRSLPRPRKGTRQRSTVALRAIEVT